jgi:hypothetical protein
MRIRGLIAVLLPLSAVFVAGGASAASSPHAVAIQVPRTLIAGVPVIRITSDATTSARQLPALVTSPSIATTWHEIGPHQFAALTTASLTPGSTLTVNAPTTISCSDSACRFTSTRAISIDVPLNVTWLQSLLAVTNYLPVSFTSTSGSAPTSPSVTGTFAWRFPLLPLSVHSLWIPGVNNVLIKGALMSFQNEHAMRATGIADSATVSALVDMVTAGKVSSRTWNYVDVSERRPQRATLFVDGVQKMSTLANTGVAGATTDLGTYPVYIHIKFQWMTGQNLDGSHYRDPVNWISYFNGGDALHEFYRYTYGWPQSLGCVEMPHSAAQAMWPYTPIGTLVTVHA